MVKPPMDWREVRSVKRRLWKRFADHPTGPTHGHYPTVRIRPTSRRFDRRQGRRTGKWQLRNCVLCSMQRNQGRSQNPNAQQKARSHGGINFGGCHFIVRSSPCSQDNDTYSLCAGATTIVTLSNAWEFVYKIISMPLYLIIAREGIWVLSWLETVNYLRIFDYPCSSD